MPMSEMGWIECNRQKPELPDHVGVWIRNITGIESIGPMNVGFWDWRCMTHYRFANPEDAARYYPECMGIPAKPADEGWIVNNFERPALPDETLIRYWRLSPEGDIKDPPAAERLDALLWEVVYSYQLAPDQPWIRCDGVKPSLPAGTRIHVKDGGTEYVDDTGSFVNDWHWHRGVTHYKITVLGSDPTTQQPMKVGTPAWTRRKTALTERYYIRGTPTPGHNLVRWYERMESNQDAGRYRLVDNPTGFLELKREYAGRAAVVRKAVQSKDHMAIYWMRHNQSFNKRAPALDSEAYLLIGACSDKFRRHAAQRWEEPSFMGTLRDRVYQTLELRMLLDNHFVHVSEDDPMKVAFVPNYDKLKADLYTRMKPGKYLTKFFGSVLSGQEIKKLAEEYAVAHGPVEVKFARDEASIVRAIAEGPSESCMANLCHSDSRTDYSRWAGKVHPAAVYAGSGDFEVAYVENAQGEVTGRVICNARKKLMARPYGDYSRMVKELERQGYRSEDGALLACRLRVIPSGNDDYPYIMAYVDAGTASGGGHLYFTEIQDKQGNWFLTTSDESDCSTYDGYDNNGVTDAQAGEDDKDDEDDDEDHYTCDSCGDRFHIDARHYSEYHQRDFCPGCARCYWTLAYTGGRDEDYVNDDEVVEFDGISYLDDAGVLSAHGLVKLHNGDVEKLDNTAFIDGDYYHIDDCVMLKTCYYDGEFALEEDCVKDYQDDWIKRCDAVEIGPDQYRHTDDAEELEAA